MATAKYYAFWSGSQCGCGGAKQIVTIDIPDPPPPPPPAPQVVQLIATVPNVAPGSTSTGYQAGYSQLHYSVGTGLQSLTLRIRAMMEYRNYTGGGTVEGPWISGGTSASATTGNNTIAKLTISSPEQVYFLNPGPTNLPTASIIEYTKTIQINAGAFVTLLLDSVDSLQLPPSAGMVSEYPSYPLGFTQPYDGQFCVIDLLI